MTILRQTFIGLCLGILGLTLAMPVAEAQTAKTTRDQQRRRSAFLFRLGRQRDSLRAKREKPEQPCIYFPQAPAPKEWRKSIGIVFTSTPPEITEEVRISVPAIDLNLQRGLSKRLFVVSRLQTQVVQSNLMVGLRWAKQLNEKVFISVGDDMNGWFGALKIKDVFNTQAHGFTNTPNVSVGYRLTRNLQLLAKTEAIYDLYYQTQVGSLTVVDKKPQLSGVAFTFMLEQPFYNKQHVSLGLRALYAQRNWQFWSLYETFDQPLFYPQLIFGFIL